MQLLTMSAVLVLLVPITVAIRGTLTPALLLLPVLVALLFCFVLGFALIIAVLHAYYRDVAPILTAALLPWFFITPIYYEPSQLSVLASHPAVRWLLEWGNPLAPFIQAIRSVLYDGSVGNVGWTLYSLVAAAIMLALGSVVFRRLQGELAVVV